MNEHALQRLEYPQVIEILSDFATSGLGRRAVQLIEPLSDLPQVETLLAQTTELKAQLMPDQDLPMGGLHDLAPILLKLEKGEDLLGIDDILEVGDTLRAARNVKAYLDDADQAYPALARVAQRIGLFAELEGHIERTFNEGGGWRSSASSRLKNLRNEVQTLRGRLRGKLTKLMRTEFGAHLQDTNIREFDNRPALAVRASSASKVRGVQRGRSDSGGTIFIEPEGVRELGNELAQALNDEKQEMLRIMRELTAGIAERLQDLHTTLAAMAHIDMTYAKVRMSRAFSMNRPQLNTEGQIRLVEARHPLLLDLHRRDGIEEVIPIDVHLGYDFHTLIITGPNTGGKTVTLKTIGLLTLMAMSGMHVPADPLSSLPVLSCVWADIGDEQSIEQSLSTFSSHLLQIGQILREADGDSLVLLDELGGGTDPVEGGALARAILEFLHEKGVRTAVTTHISQLKILGYSVPGMENASIEFDVETLKPTHKILLGTPGGSNALILARRLGLPVEVTTRAEQPQGDGASDLMNELQGARAQTLINRNEAQQERERTRHLETETRRKLEDLQAHEDELKVNNGQAAYTTLRDLRREFETLRREEPSKRALLTALDQMAKTIDNELQRQPAVTVERQLSVGDRVHVRSLDKMGELIEMNEKSGKAVVDFGGLPMTVALDDLGV